MRDRAAFADDVVDVAVGMGDIHLEIKRIVRGLECECGHYRVPRRDALGQHALSADDVGSGPLAQCHIVAGADGELLSGAVQHHVDIAQRARVGSVPHRQFHPPFQRKLVG